MPVLLYLLGVAVFAQGTSEFVLAGLLPAIASDLDVSLRSAGLLTSAFALGLVVGAPATAPLARRFSARWSLTGFLALFVIAHVVGAVTADFGVLLGTRVVSALAYAGFLATSLSTVTRIVPAERLARALAVLLGGTTLALIAGVPLGAVVGEALGWRATLWAIALLCLPALISVLIAAPGRIRDDDAAARIAIGREVRTLLRRPVQLNIALAVLINGATFCTFTYLAAIATGAGRLSDGAVPLLLSVFGVGAFLGVRLAGRLGDRHWRALLTIAGPVLVAGWAVFAAVADLPVMLFACALAQGVLSFAVGSTVVARIIATADGAPTMGGSFATAALNVGAVLGPVTGGIALDALGDRGPMLASAILAAVAVCLWFITPRRASLAREGRDTGEALREDRDRT